jgi:hypothetical protein
LSPGIRKFLVPFVIVDAVFVIALAAYFYYRFEAKPLMQIVLRHPESKLTEIDLVNNGRGSGSLFIAIEANWPDADLVDTKGLSQFDEIDTSRHSLRFYPQPSLQNTRLHPGESWAVGWIKLTDDVPVNAEISNNVTTQP